MKASLVIDTENEYLQLEWNEGDKLCVVRMNTKLMDDHITFVRLLNNEFENIQHELRELVNQ